MVAKIAIRHGNLAASETGEKGVQSWGLASKRVCQPGGDCARVI